MNMGSNFSEDEDGCEKSLNAMEWHLESEAPYMTHHSFGFKFHFVNNQTDEAHIRHLRIWQILWLPLFFLLDLSSSFQGICFSL